MISTPSRWTHARISDVCVSTESRDPRLHPGSQFTYIDIGGVDGERHVIAETKQMVGSNAPSRGRQIVRRDDTLLSTVRTYLTKTALVPEYLDGAIASTGFCVLRPGPTVDPRFLFYRTLESSFVAALSAKQTGSSYPAVRDHDVRDMGIDVPSLVEQRRIAEVIEEQLSRLDAAQRSLSPLNGNARFWRGSYYVKRASDRGPRLHWATSQDRCATEFSYRVRRPPRQAFRSSVSAPCVRCF